MRKIVVAASLAAIAAAAPAAAHGAVSAQAQAQVRAQAALADLPAVRNAKRLKPALVRRSRAVLHGYYGE